MTTHSSKTIIFKKNIKSKTYPIKKKPTRQTTYHPTKEWRYGIIEILKDEEFMLVDEILAKINKKIRTLNTAIKDLRDEGLIKSKLCPRCGVGRGYCLTK